MRIYFTHHFQRNYQKLPKEVQSSFDKQLAYLLKNMRHPSLRAKKYDESRSLWQARVTDSYRFYFEIKGNSYIFHEIRAHKD